MILRCGGIVLCGGKSLRMGQSKARLPFHGETLLARVVRILGEVVDPIVVVAAANQDLPPLPAGVVVAHDQASDRGPLQGISAGLHALEGKADVAYVSSCDVPLLRPAFVRRIVGLLGEHGVCAPQCNAIHHPLAAAYRVNVVNVVDQLLGANRLRTKELLTLVPTRLVTEEEIRDVDPDLQSLWNMNTPEDYAAALRSTTSS